MTVLPRNFMRAGGGLRRIVRPSSFHDWDRFHVAADPDWLIAGGRLISVLFAALAIYLDPTRPTRSLSAAHIVLATYLLFSIGMAIRLIRKPTANINHLVEHGLDVVALAFLVYFTDELDSPFFSLGPFILLSTTMRWGMRGAVLGALVVEVMMIAVGWQDLTDGDAELNFLIMRSAYFLVAAAMLGYFGACRARSSHRFAQLAGWSAAPANIDRETWLHDMLDHASKLLGAGRLLLVWQDQERAGRYAVMFGPEGLQMRDDLPPRLWQARQIGDASKELASTLEIAEITAFAEATGWQQLTMHPRGLRSAPFEGARNAGRLFALDVPDRQDDFASLMRITTLRIGDELERFDLMRAMEDQARDQERVRLARDLHDSVLQDLTAASLKLKAAGAALPQREREPLNSVSTMLTAQQRRIRIFVESSRSAGTSPRRLSTSLSQEVDILRDQWGCEIALTVHPDDMEVPAAIRRELKQLLCEATANAVRHGGATRIDVNLLALSGMIRMDISDNGCGMSHAEALPRSLHSRIKDLAGSLSITRHAPGLAMTIEMPMR